MSAASRPGMDIRLLTRCSVVKEPRTAASAVYRSICLPDHQHRRQAELLTGHEAEGKSEQLAA